MEVRLVVVGGKRAGKEFAIAGPTFLIGRAPQCRLQLKSHLVSRKHCAISIDAKSAAIDDLGSTNGTLVNGEKIQERRELNNGDRIKIGLLELEVRLTPIAGGKKTPEVHPVAKAAVAADDLDISSWLEEDGPGQGAASPSEKPAALHDTAAAKTLDDTVCMPANPEADEKKPESSVKIAGQFKRAKKPTAVSSRSAAEDVLKQFFSKKKP